MKINKLLVLAPVTALAFVTSCGQSRRYENSAYQINLQWNNHTTRKFNILQLTDLHISNATDNEKHFNFIKETVKLAREKVKKAADNEDIDLIAITGDMFTFAGRSEANELFAFFDSLKINWAPTFGNHDEQVYFPVDWLTGRLNELNNLRAQGKSYCVFRDLQDDDVFGNANYVINLKDGKSIIEQLYFFDSNRYNFGEYRGYDYIHYDQIDWYERQLSEIESETSPDKPKSLAFFHIPFPEFEENYKKAKAGSGKYIFRKDPDTGKTMDEHDSGTGDPKKNTGLYNVMKRHALTNGVFVGHNHTSSYVIDDTTTENTITLAFGVKSTNRVYCDDTKLGGQIISIYGQSDAQHSVGDFDISRVYHTYAK